MQHAVLRVSVDRSVQLDRMYHQRQRVVKDSQVFHTYILLGGSQACPQYSPRRLWHLTRRFEGLREYGIMGAKAAYIDVIASNPFLRPSVTRAHDCNHKDNKTRHESILPKLSR